MADVTQTTKKKFLKKDGTPKKPTAYEQGFADGAVSMKWNIICEINACLSKVQEIRHQGITKIEVEKL